MFFTQAVISTGGGGGTVTSVSGTANRITSTGGTTPVIDISASYVGQASITTLGTITTGVWNGTAIANANLANSTISGVSLGGNLFALTIGTGLSGTSYNGSAGVIIAIDGTVVTLTGAQALSNKTGLISQWTNDSGYITSIAGAVTSVSGTSNRITSSGGSTPIIDISASYVGQASITTLGTIGTGTWQGTSISTTYTDAKIKTVTGTSNRVTIGGTATDPTFDISVAYVGQATITTVGTLTSGATGAGFTLALSASTITGTLGVTNGGTGTTTAFTAGSIIFAGASGIYTQDNSMFFWDDANNILYVGANSAAFTNTRAQFQSNVAAYSQVNHFNSNAGNSASTDYIATADNGTDSTNYIDFGINSSTYNDAAYTITGINGGYLYNVGGDLSIGTATSGKVFKLHTGGTLAVNLRVTISDSTVTLHAYGTGALSTNSSGVISAGTLAATNGGTGQATYTIGDILYASSTSALSRLADVATGNVLISGGVGVAPSWGQVSLTTAVSGILPSANGGTGINNSTNTLTLGGVTSITGGGTIALAGFTLTVPATGTATLGTGSNQSIGVWSGTNTMSTASGFTYVSPVLTLSVANNGITNILSNNSNATAAAQGRITAKNGTSSLYSTVYGTSFTTAGLVVAGLANVGTDSATGLLFSSTGASTTYWWTIGGTGTANEYMRLTTTGLGVLTAANPTKALEVKGDVLLNTAGNGFYVKEGTNATMGTATLVGGTATVSTTKVTANSRILLCAQSLGTVSVGQGLAVSARTAATSFTITSGSAIDTSTVMWIIMEPG